MRHVMDNAEESVRRVIDRIGGGRFEYTMDDGAPLRVAVTVDHAATQRASSISPAPAHSAITTISIPRRR